MISAIRLSGAMLVLLTVYVRETASVISELLFVKSYFMDLSILPDSDSDFYMEMKHNNILKAYIMLREMLSIV